MIRRLAILPVFALAVAAPAMAEGLKLKPGLWEMTYQYQAAMFGQAKDETEVNCVTPDKAELDPQKLLDDSIPCKPANLKTEGGVMTFDVVCEGLGEGTGGKARFETDGDAGSGKIDMIMKMGDMAIPMNASMTAKRLGACES